MTMEDSYESSYHDISKIGFARNLGVRFKKCHRLKHFRMGLRILFLSVVCGQSNGSLVSCWEDFGLV